MIGDCEYCGLKGVLLILVEGSWLCADKEACEEEYDRVTVDEGWLW
jgi:hypothetical protein